MDIKLLRIDSRLVHGQVANNWAGTLGAEAILAVSDGAANDELRKTLMLQTGGGKVKVHVLGVEKAARVYKNPKYANLKAVIVVETPADVVRLLDLGVKADEVNVGGMTFKQGTKALSQAVYISDEDAKAFQEIDKRGITQYIPQVPSPGRSDRMEALTTKGLISVNNARPVVAPPRPGRGVGTRGGAPTPRAPGPVR